MKCIKQHLKIPPSVEGTAEDNKSPIQVSSSDYNTSTSLYFMFLFYFESSTGEVVEQISVDLSIYAMTQQFIEKGTILTWQQIKDTFAEEFKEDLEDRQVYISIKRSSLYKVACTYLAFPCADIIIWIVSHTYPNTMTLSSASGIEISTFRADKFHQM